MTNTFGKMLHEIWKNVYTYIPIRSAYLFISKVR